MTELTISLWASWTQIHQHKTSRLRFFSLHFLIQSLPESCCNTGKSDSHQWCCQQLLFPITWHTQASCGCFAFGSTEFGGGEMVFLMWWHLNWWWHRHTLVGPMSQHWTEPNPPPHADGALLQDTNLFFWLWTFSLTTVSRNLGTWDVPYNRYVFSLTRRARRNICPSWAAKRWKLENSLSLTRGGH